MEWLPIVQNVLTPLIGSSSHLIADLISGAKSLATAKAEIANLLLIATNRLTEIDTKWEADDKRESARVAQLPLPTVQTK